MPLRSDFQTAAFSLLSRRHSHYSTIGGGRLNIIHTNANYSSIGGGYNNTIQNYSIRATIAGGQLNTIQSNAYYAAIGGGFNNLATGGNAVVPGGDYNVAGANSFAAGHRAKATHAGAFVWADSTELDFTTTANNQFLIRANGGVGIGKNNPATALDVNGTVTATAFNPSSDRNLKENFTGVSPAEMLDKVAGLKISRWNFRGDTTTPHVGPMAQDFYAAFGLGTDERHIATVDADGVALAAIQGLNQKLEAKEAEITELKQRLEKLERLINQNNGGAK